METKAKTTEQLFKENEKLLKKIAWNVCKKSGYDFDDLYSEALLSFVEKQQKYDDKHKFSTFIYSIVQNHLYNYINEKKQIKNDDSDVVSLDVIETQTGEEDSDILYLKDMILDTPYLPTPLIKDKNAEFIKDLIMQSPQKYLFLSPFSAIKQLTKDLKQLGWKVKDIKIGINQLKSSLC